MIAAPLSALQLYPPLDAATEAALRAAIVRFGVIVPVVVTQHGEIIDGHHRGRIAGELGVEFETHVVVVSGPDEARASTGSAPAVGESAVSSAAPSVLRGDLERAGVEQLTLGVAA